MAKGEGLRFKILTLISIVSLFCSPGWGVENCFFRHIQEASDLNLIRKPIYSKLTGGYTAEISDRLIQLEQGMYLPVLLMDRLAQKYHAKGVRFLCNELKEMKLTPALPKNLPLKSAPEPKSFKNLNIRKMQNELQTGLDQGFEELLIVIEKYLHTLENEPRVNCLVRHFLESIRSFAEWNSIYKSQLPAYDFSKLQRLNKLIISSHIYYLSESHALDELALNVQIFGVPILCQDVPAIPSIRK